MPLKIIRDDITRLKCDAVVNPTDSCYSGSGGADRAIHEAAGTGLAGECAALESCMPGQAKLTNAFGLPCRYIIHTVGPIWVDGRHDEEDILSACYRNSLKLAEEYGCESAGFPIISAGTYGFPKDRALRTAINEISDFLMHSDMLVYLVVYDRECYRISRSLYADVADYIGENYVSAADVRYSVSSTNIAGGMPYRAKKERNNRLEGFRRPAGEDEEIVCLSIPSPCMDYGASKPGLGDILKQLDESFSQMLLRKIDESGMTDAQCYKKANIDRKLFSKIRSDMNYKPSKSTALAFAIALELPLEETQDMLKKAGYALSHSNKFDVIIEYFIRNGNYNIFEINETLFAFDQSLLGG